MKQRLAELADRKLGLLEKIRTQRLEVAEISMDFQRPLALADTVLKVVHFSRNHPALVSGGFAALLSIRGMGIAGLAKKGWRLLYLYPAALSLGLKYLFPGPRPDREARNAGVDHSQE
ncbi:MAG: YqjK family protein [Gallionella sp.]